MTFIKQKTLRFLGNNGLVQYFKNENFDKLLTYSDFISHRQRKSSFQRLLCIKTVYNTETQNRCSI